MSAVGVAVAATALLGATAAQAAPEVQIDPASESRPTDWWSTTGPWPNNAEGKLDCETSAQELRDMYPGQGIVLPVQGCYHSSPGYYYNVHQAGEPPR